MAIYNINNIGSNICTHPSSLNKGDILNFNVTNTNISTKYSGTIMEYTFPFDCTVEITASGACGGMGNKCVYNSDVGGGATIFGTFIFNKNDKILIAVGGAGTSYIGSSSDGTTGAGGGSSTVAKVVPSSPYLMKHNDFIGVYVEPLIIGAGGNGGRDIGYSGQGSVYNGDISTNSSHTSLNMFSGGCFDDEYYNETSGSSFLKGNFGATKNMERGGSTSYAGFGGGGGNTDDVGGGGGGGYHGGVRDKSSARSYNSGSNQGYSTSYNYGEGKITIEILSIAGAKGATTPIKVNNEWKDSKPYVKVNGVWKEVISTHIKVNGVWKETI